MDTRQTALIRFESFYEALDVALDEGDAEQVAELVDARAAAVEALLDAYQGAPLPEALREQLAAREAELTARMITYYDELAEALGDQQRRSQATRRYASAG